MQIINFLSSLAMPLIILLIITYGVIEKNKVFDDFLEGGDRNSIQHIAYTDRIICSNWSIKKFRNFRYNNPIYFTIIECYKLSK